MKTRINQICHHCIILALLLFVTGCGRNEPIVGSWEDRYATVHITITKYGNYTGKGESGRTTLAKWEKVTGNESKIEYKCTIVSEGENKGQSFTIDFDKKDPNALVIDGWAYKRTGSSDAYRFFGSWTGRGYTEGNEVKLTINKDKEWTAKVQFGTKNGWETFSGTWIEGRDGIDLKVANYKCTDSYMESVAKSRGVIGATGRCRYQNDDTLSFNCPGSGGTNYEMKRR